MSTGTVSALKEWGAAVHALLDGRQTVLLRKGGIHEKVFDAGVASEFVLFPTVAHSHAERVRPEHRDVLAAGALDSTAEQVVVRAGARVVAAIEVGRPEAVADLADLHIWTWESVEADRVAFRPKHPLHVLVLEAVELPQAVTLPRVEAYRGCSSWLDLPLAWTGDGRAVHDRALLEAVADRVRATVGATARA